MYDYKIQGINGFAEVAITLKAEEKLKAEAGAMSYMDGSVTLETKSGSVMQGLKRKLSGESFFQNIYQGPGKIVLAPTLPGDIIDFEVNAGQGWLLQKDAYISGDPAVEVSGKWGGFKSVFAGEGGILTHVSIPEGKGTIFLGGYGSIEKNEIKAGEEFVVDTGIFFATEDTTHYKLSKVGGLKSFAFGGEGVVLRFTGPCTVYTQSRAQQSLVNMILSRIPQSS